MKTRGDLYVLVCIRWLSCNFFFAYFFFAFALFRSSRLVSIEGDRRLEGSSAQHANVYLCSRSIHLRDIVVVVRSMPMCIYAVDVYT